MTAQSPTDQPGPSQPVRGQANIATWVSERAASDPSLPAIKQGETILSYGALDGAAARMATLLAGHGVTAGDRVAMMMPNVAYFPIVYYAILRLGAIVVPMNPLLKAGEIAYAWNDSGAKVAVVFPMFADEATKAAERDRHRRDHHRARASSTSSWPGSNRSETVADRALDRHRGDPVHLRHHRSAQGRRAHPCQSRQQCPDRRSRRCCRWRPVT